MQELPGNFQQNANDTTQKVAIYEKRPLLLSKNNGLVHMFCTLRLLSASTLHILEDVLRSPLEDFSCSRPSSACRVCCTQRWTLNVILTTVISWTCEGQWAMANWAKGLCRPNSQASIPSFNMQPLQRVAGLLLSAARAEHVHRQRWAECGRCHVHSKSPDLANCYGLYISSYEWFNL